MPCCSDIRSRLRTLIILAALCPAATGYAQQIGEGEYWIYFTDKDNNGFSPDDPLSFLSERSVNRRAWQGLGVDLTDEPVTRAYVEELQAMGVRIRHVSRWMNGLAMTGASDSLFSQVLALPFTDTLPWQVPKHQTYFPPVPEGERFEPPLEQAPDFDYGVATEQVQQLKLEVLHQAGFTGRGVWIALLDAGFRNVDSLPSFEAMIGEGRLLGARNFVNDSSVFDLVMNNHGMYVLSIMGGLWDHFLVGTAPHASYFLCTTENIRSETRMEEIAWIEAAEYMDSLGFDVFNTSLGYWDFDSTLYDYTYSDLDGQTALISRAASLLADKGIIACNSAGNEGSSSWYRIIAPADARNIIPVGAVDSLGQIAYFSSRGPSFDGRITPLVVAMGRYTGIQGASGNVTRGSGTSFSSPVITGSVASLWQAYPDVSAKEMIYRIRETGNRVLNPDVTYGYGIPDFARAYYTISSTREHQGPLEAMVFPNPAVDRLNIRLPQSEHGTFELCLVDLGGRMIFRDHVQLPGVVVLPAHLQTGIYILEVRTAAYTCRNRIMIR
jgi:serine protease AprX